MRFIPLNCIRSGQVLASDLIIDPNRLMLRKGITLTPSMVSRIRLLGFQGVYIEDDISRDIEVANVISDELKYKAKKEVRSLFMSMEHNMYNKTAKHIDMLSNIVANIVDELLNNKNVMINMVDLRSYDDYTYSHSISVAILAVMIGTVLGLNKKALNELGMGALVHDIGKVFIDKEIINKPGKLTIEEFTEIKKHSYMGYDYLNLNSNIPKSVKYAVLMHHEKFNGSGYPSGLSGNAIHLFGRIICVADVYDALTSDRPYRPALLPSDAVEYIMSGYSAMFEPMIVDAFTKKVAAYPIGTCVKLSNNDVAIVVNNYESACLRPKVRLLHDNKPTNDYIDLAHDHASLNITIKEIINL